MGVILMMRNRSNSSYYDALFALFDAYSGCIDEVMIGSDLFYEGHSFGLHKGTYSVLDRKNTNPGMGNSGKTLLDQFRSLSEVKILGIRKYIEKGSNITSTREYTEFCNFVNRIRNEHSGLKVKAGCHKNGKWNARVILMRSRGKVMAGIVGSSDFTRESVEEYGNASRIRIDMDVVFYDYRGDRDNKLSMRLRNVGGWNVEGSGITITCSDPDRDPYEKPYRDPYEDPYRALNRRNDMSMLDDLYDSIDEMLSDKSIFIDV